MSDKPVLRALPPPLPKRCVTPTPETLPAASEATGARPPGAFRVGRYEVNAQLASGGMATVHLGRVLGAAGFSRVVAIKRLLPQFASDPDFETMFVTEAELAARIRHPHVVPTLDVVASDGEILLVMEYVHGETLARLIGAARSAGGVPMGIALRIVCDALHGLHAAHEAKDRSGKPIGLVHRDVSPQNVIVGVDGVARVIDFGIAKAVTSLDTTKDGLVRGKVSYMAPEQLLSEPLSRRTDLYAVGVMLWELLVGDRLFPGGSRPDLLRKVEGHIDRPKSRVPSLPERLDAIVMRALATDPNDRYTDALALANDLERTGLEAKRSDVAPFVERFAGDALAKRAALVESVESEARSVPPPPAPLASATGALAPMVAPISAAPRRSAGSRTRVLAVAAGAVLFAGVMTGVLLARTTNGAAGAAGSSTNTEPLAKLAAAAATAKEPTAAAPSTPSPVAAATTPIAPLTAAAPPAVSAGAGPASTASETPRPTPAPRSTSVRAGATKTAKKPAKSAQCNPPYTLDAKRRRRYKAECF